MSQDATTTSKTGWGGRVPAGAVSSAVVSTGATAAVSVVVTGVSSWGTSTGFCSSAIVIDVVGRKLGISRKKKPKTENKEAVLMEPKYVWSLYWCGKGIKREATTEVCGIRRVKGQEFGLGRTLFVFWEMGGG